MDGITTSLSSSVTTYKNCLSNYFIKLLNKHLLSIFWVQTLPCTTDTLPGKNRCQRVHCLVKETDHKLPINPRPIWWVLWKGSHKTEGLRKSHVREGGGEVSGPGQCFSKDLCSRQVLFYFNVLSIIDRCFYQIQYK